MNFFTMQSLNTYTKNMQMKMKWNQKKKNSDFTADGSTKLLDATARQAEEIRKSQADGSAKLSSQIRMKLANGKKLTAEEMEYLQKTDPQTYQKVKSIEAEKKSYEKELKDCKTKEDVQRVKTNHVAASLSVVNSVKNNPAIPESAKLGIMWQELQKCMALEEATKQFIESGQYAQLPTEAEKQQAEKELQEAKEAELGIKDPAENMEDKDLADNDSVDDSYADKDIEKNESAAGDLKGVNSSDKASEVSVHEAVQKIKAALQEHKMTRAEADSTPEAQKVKRTRAHAAYKKNQIEMPDQVIDLKAE